MRVIVVNDFAYVNGGAASVAIASALGLARRGHHVCFLSAVGPVDPRLVEAGIDVICTGQNEILQDSNRLRAATQGLWNLRSGREVARLVAAAPRKDTVIHLHGWSKALSVSVVRAFLDRGSKIVCTLHDYFAACPNGGFFDYQSLSHCKLEALSASCIMRNCDSRSYTHKLWRVARQFIQQKAGHLPGGVGAFIVLSRLSRDALRAYLPVRAHIFEIPNPIDVCQEPPVRVAQNETFVMIGRLAREKGGVLFADAARETGLPAMFIGDGPCRREIEAANPKAQFTGWISRDEVCRYLSSARAAVFPSLWYEAQPLAVLESAARGVPAVVSNGCAGAECVTDGATGLYFENGNVRDLAAALAKLSNENLVRRLGVNAYEQYWKDPPTLERHVLRLEQAYEVVLRGGSNRLSF